MGAVLVESGPGSTLHALENALNEQGLQLSDVTHVLLTHIHLDHAGAAGKLAQNGATICVHPAGAPHILILKNCSPVLHGSTATKWIPLG